MSISAQHIKKNAHFLVFDKCGDFQPLKVLTRSSNVLKIYIHKYTCKNITDNKTILIRKETRDITRGRR